MEENVATRLARGMKNLDRMSKEIEMIITRLMPFAEDEVYDLLGIDPISIRINPRQADITKADPCIWELYSDSRSRLALRHRGGRDIYRHGKFVQPALGWINMVHADLPSLIHGLVGNFPTFHMNLKPFADAADMEF